MTHVERDMSSLRFEQQRADSNSSARPMMVVADAIIDLLNFNLDFGILIDSSEGRKIGVVVYQESGNSCSHSKVCVDTENGTEMTNRRIIYLV